MGRAFTADVAAAASGFDERTFVSALDELWRRGIVRAHGPSAYDFSHGRIRDAAYAALRPPRQRRAHLAVARALEEGGGAAAALAAHYEKAGATAAAVRWHERAARDAQWLHAHADAARALERALELSDGLPRGPGTARLQLRLLTALPAPLVACEGHGSERMARVHARALRLADRLGGEPDPPLVWSLALAALTRGSGRRRTGSVSGCGRAPNGTATRCCGWRPTTSTGSPPIGRGTWSGRAGISRRRCGGSGPRGAGRTSCATGRTPS